MGIAEVRWRTGIPVASDFASAIGSPIVGDLATGNMYVLANEIVVAITGNAVAQGDGTTDDTTQLQAYITRSAGSVAKLQPGRTYLVSGVTVPANTVVDMTGATVKLKVLVAGVGTAIFTVQGTGCTFIGGTLNGQASLQPADGFSDSFDTGAGGTGRAYRSAILADHAAFSSIASLTVRGVEFTGCYGACVAARDISDLTVQDCYAHDTYFECGYSYYVASAPSNITYLNNRGKNVASGSATVNSDFLVASRATRVTVIGNKCSAVERCLVKIESCSSVTISGNVGESSTINNIPCIQIDGATGANRICVTGNTIYNYGAGISLSSGDYLGINISGNTIYTTTGTATGDGIIVACTTASGLNISNNILWDIKRHAFSISGAIAGASINGNTCDGQVTSGQYGMTINATGNITDLSISGNTWRQFEQSAVGAGVVNFARSAAFTISNFTFQHNRIFAGAAANRALRTAGVDLFGVGIFSDNLIDGQLELFSATPRYRDNEVSGTITLPAGTVNVESIGASQTTVGAAGGASAIPTPVGYEIRNVSGTNRAFPYCNA